MKTKLKKFTEFSKSILPHEAYFLTSIVRFTDREKMAITNRVIENATSKTKPKPFDTEIDKRKYSYLKKWITKKLGEIDVDKNIAWLSYLKERLLTDQIEAKDENELLKYIGQYKEITHFFQFFYELVREYKSYLLIRMRYQDHEIVAAFIDSYKKHYNKAIEIYDKLYMATAEITDQYTLKKSDTKSWEKWLLQVFNSSDIDGKNRYQAFVLLAFMYTNYNDNESLKSIFEKMDGYFAKGEMYSKRFLCNYYNSRLLMHSRDNDLDSAAYYGYLSITNTNDDTLMYANNLAAILLKSHKTNEALSLLNANNELYEKSSNYHQKTGYISYLIRALTNLENIEAACDLARSYLRENIEQILKHRWHHFFTSYINALIVAENYNEVLKLDNKYNLLKREKERINSTYYIPNIWWSILLSKYMEGRLSSDRLLSEIKEPLEHMSPTESQRVILVRVIENLSKNLPEAFLKLKSHL